MILVKSKIGFGKNIIRMLLYIDLLVDLMFLNLFMKKDLEAEEILTQ